MRKGLISKMKGKFINSSLASNVVLGFILAGFEKLVESEFAFSSKPRQNALFASAYCVFPGVIASVLMLCKGCKLKSYKELEHFVLFFFFFIVPTMMWLILIFLDVQFYACAKTDWSSRFVIVDKTTHQNCEPHNTSSQEKIYQTLQRFYYSQV